MGDASGLWKGSSREGEGKFEMSINFWKGCVTTNFLSILIVELVSAGAILHMVGINALMLDEP